MRSSIVVLMLPLLIATSAGAQERTALPGIVVGSPPPGPPASVLEPPPAPAPAPMMLGPSQEADASRRGGGASLTRERCVDVTIGNDRSYGCLNEKLKKEVDKVNPTANIPPFDAKSADPKIGVVNIPGVQQQYGSNFGVSVYPYRPGAPVYTSPIGHR